jgi:RES domain-containing protein
MNLWRISKYHDLLGEGGMKASARWHTRGSRIVYLADSPAGALLEILVHLEIDKEDIPEPYSLLRIAAPEDVAVESLTPPAGEGWKQDEDLTRRMGDSWLNTGESALARVPGAIISESWNYLLNPEHPLAERVKIESIIQERYDRRLFRFGSR